MIQLAVPCGKGQSSTLTAKLCSLGLLSTGTTAQGVPLNIRGCLQGLVPARRSAALCVATVHLFTEVELQAPG